MYLIFLWFHGGILSLYTQYGSFHYDYSTVTHSMHTKIGSTDWTVESMEQIRKILIPKSIPQNILLWLQISPSTCRSFTERDTCLIRAWSKSYDSNLHLFSFNCPIEVIYDFSLKENWLRYPSCEHERQSRVPLTVRCVERINKSNNVCAASHIVLLLTTWFCSISHLYPSKNVISLTNMNGVSLRHTSIRYNVEMSKWDTGRVIKMTSMISLYIHANPRKVDAINIPSSCGRMIWTSSLIEPCNTHSSAAYEMFLCST